MGVPTSGDFNMFGTATTASIAGAIEAGGSNVSSLTTFEELISASNASLFDSTYAGTITTPSTDVSASLQYRNYPIVPVVYYSCGTTVTNSTALLTSGTYPTVFVNPTDTAAGRTLTWNTEGVNRPNKYDLYANGVFVASTGWKGTADYWGPWGNFSLNFIENNLVFPKNYGKGRLFLISPKAEINFSKNLFWTTFMQYNTQRDNFNINSRLQWRYLPMSDLFLVYSDNYLVDNFGPRNRAFVIKLNYWSNL